MTTHQTNGTPNSSPRTLYLGPEASFSHQAAVEALPNTQPTPLPSFTAILTAIQQSGKTPSENDDHAVLPIENSTNGSVVQALDLLAQCRLDPESSAFPDVEVIDEHYLEVHHCLFVARSWAEQKLTKEEIETLDAGHDETPDRKRLEQLLPKLNIKTLYTHPQVWGQCNKFLSSMLPPGHVDRVDMSSTSAAAAFVANHPPSNDQDDQADSGIAAISSSLAGAKHGRNLIMLAQNIEDEPGSNTTRFLILRNRLLPRRPLPPSNPSDPPNETSQLKSLFTFTIPHRIPGSLAKALAVFAKHGFNLSAIQSRPKPRLKGTTETDTVANGVSAHNKQGSNWKYVFFIECLHGRADGLDGRDGKEMEELERELRIVTEQLCLLGSWLIA